MTALLEVSDLVRKYEVRRGAWPFGQVATLQAVDGVSFRLEAGRTLGLVGESGCGKTTTAKLVLGLVPITSGSVTIAGEPLPPIGSMEWRAIRRRMQMVYQDPLGALDRRLSVGRQVMEPLAIHGIGEPKQRRDKALAMLDAVGLAAHHFDRYPHELSGGQRQRIVLGRALILDPQLLVCDEPISALDVSIQAQVVNLLLDLQQRLGLAYLFISHDLAVVETLADRIAVMYRGRFVETGPADEVFRRPMHPYTRLLVETEPRLDQTKRRTGRRQTASAPPGNELASWTTGCAFAPRCPHAKPDCTARVPGTVALDGDHHVTCHFAGRI